MQRDTYDSDHEDFRQAVRAFIARDVQPHHGRWENEGLIERTAWEAAGQQGLIGIAVPEEFGGGGTPDFRYRLIIMEELAAAAANSFNAGLSVQDDLVIPYLVDLGSQEQKARWLPGLCAGTLIGSLAMTEPGTGSDLRSIRTTAVSSADGWILDGQKTFITNGMHADVVIVFARTNPDSSNAAFSLFLVDTLSEGFRRGRKLEKVGLRGNDTAELYFDQIHLPREALLGVEGAGFSHLMDRLPRERLAIAATSLAASSAAFEWTKSYCFERKAFGRPVGDFQNTRFTLAEIATELDFGWAFLDRAVHLLNAEELSAVDAAKAKWWMTALHQRVVDQCVQLHGGYGYMLEYPIARAFLDARIQPIYGGTNEIMKEIIGRDIADRTRSQV
ncbi:acyl-CoA dehydrogenase family protein [Rhodococcus sp. NPDC059968]|uniref:acyl-CoA dehydrogenase family protein n=1 Tax=Rhodococcus sp. NPDC059968 TaxID=3347017 RepID=UPI00366F4535